MGLYNAEITFRRIEKVAVDVVGQFPVTEQGKLN